MAVAVVSMVEWEALTEEVSQGMDFTADLFMVAPGDSMEVTVWDAASFMVIPAIGLTMARDGVTPTTVTLITLIPRMVTLTLIRIRFPRPTRPRMTTGMPPANPTRPPVPKQMEHFYTKSS